MPSVILCPVTISAMSPTPIEQLAPFLDDAGAERVRSADGRPVHVLGRTVKDRKKWERIERGDVVLFSDDGAVHRQGTVLHTDVNPALARHKWGVGDDGEIHDHIYIVAIDGEVVIPYARLNEASGDSPKYAPFGFRIMDEEKSARVAALLRELGVSPS